MQSHEYGQGQMYGQMGEGVWDSKLEQQIEGSNHMSMAGSTYLLAQGMNGPTFNDSNKTDDNWDAES